MESPMRSESVQGGPEPPAIATVPWVRGVLRRTPWWATSAILHLAFLLLATVLVFTVKPAEDPNKKLIVDVGPKNVSSIPLPPRTPPIDRFRPNEPDSDGEGIEDRDPTPAKIDPDAEWGEADQSANNDPHLMQLGNPKFKLAEYLGGLGEAGNLKTDEKGWSEAIGVGNADGSSGYGGEWGGMKNVKARRRGPKGPIYGSVTAGLRWLARHQDPDGHWSAEGFSGCCRGARCAGAGGRSHDVGITGLAVLAYLGAGQTPSSQKTFRDPADGRMIRYGDVVRKGLRWLMERQDPEGCFGEQEGEFLYDHAIASLALAEANWLCVTPLYRAPAQHGIDFLAKARNPGWAWRYGVRDGDNDTSVTGWCVMALKSAEVSGLDFDRTAFDGVRSWLERVTSTRGVVGYQSPGDAGSTMPGVNDRWKNHPAMTAVGLLSRIFIDKKKDAWMKVAANALVKDLPVWDEKERTVDFYYWYYAALALFQFDAPNGSAWKTFSEAMQKALLLTQEGTAKGCSHGSWNPAADKWGTVGGRVYATALNVLTLEVYFRYPLVFTGSREPPKA